MNYSGMPQTSAVRIFAGDHPMLAATVKAVLEGRRRDLLEELLTAQDWGMFCERRGRVFGIDEAIQHAIDAETKLNERG